MHPTIVTWILVLFGAITLVPLIAAQWAMLIRPDDPRTRGAIIGKGEDWRDRTHYRLSLGLAWADWVFFGPLFLAGSAGVLLGHAWGYVLFGAAGAISFYINIVLWFTEKEYVYPSRGPLRYFTYYWGFFMLWGAAAVTYSAWRLAALD